jgi:hypothetical protein
VGAGIGVKIGAIFQPQKWRTSFSFKKLAFICAGIIVHFLVTVLYLSMLQSKNQFNLIPNYLTIF